MKNVKIKAIAIALAILMFSAVVLVACGNNPAPEAFDAEAAIADFESSVNTTVKLTYVTNYEVDVVRPGVEGSGGMDSFKRDVEATVVVEMDLGDDLYIKVTKSRQDKLIEDEATVSEQILYKKDGAYYYQTSSSAAVTVDDPAAKLATIFEEATYEQIGGLTLDALLYNNLDKAYELKLIGLSDTFIEEDLVDPTYAAADNGGLKVTYKPEYVGYKTDGGWSDFKNEADGYAATVEIITNDKGYVTSMTENYNDASLVFNIMSNPPTVTITGTRSFTATYGEAITKADSVDTTPSTAALTEAIGGSYVVKTCAMGDWAHMVTVANGDSLEAGKLICVMPTANEGYELVKVVVNGSDTPIAPPANAGGYYCFNVAPGANTIEVIFKAASDEVEAPTAAYSDAEGGTFTVNTCALGDWGNMVSVANGGSLELGKLICVMPTAADGYKVAKVLVNGSEIPIANPAMAGGYYCFNVAEGENKIQVVFVTNETELATVSYASADGGSFVVKTCKNGQYNAMIDVSNGGVVVVGDIICVKPVAADGYQIASVIVNGNDEPMINPGYAGGFYCFAATSGENTVVVVFEAV